MVSPGRLNLIIGTLEVIWTSPKGRELVLFLGGLGEATLGVAALPAGSHAAEASYVSASSLTAFRAAIVRSVWSSMLDLIAHGAELHCPVQRLGLHGMDVRKDGSEQPCPLWMLSGPIQHFESAIFEAWQLNVSAQSAERQGFRGCTVSWCYLIATTT